MIAVSSRYNDSKVDVVDDPIRGVHQSVNKPLPDASSTFRFTFHQAVAGETIDGLAATFYGDGRRWWVLADANPEILDWSELLPGTVIRVPYVQ